MERKNLSVNDREKVVRGLECCASYQCSDCPYHSKTECIDALAPDALALLKEKDASIKQLSEKGLHEWNKGYRAGCEAVRKLL